MPKRPHLHRWLIAAIAAAGAQACTEEGVAPCEDPVPVRTADGQDTGYVRCADGLTDRAGSAVCQPRHEGEACSGAERQTCSVDSECDARAHGRCVAIYGGGSYYECDCRYGCGTDADCPDGSACVCLGESSACVTARCTSDADCASGRCGVGWVPEDCTTMPRLACRTDSDACQSDADCGGFDSCIVRDGVRVCESVPICGRPLMVAGERRTAPDVEAADWSAGTPGVSATLAPDLRRALARQWAAIGALEHASVASFARFTLELMASGAPAELVAEAQRAGADEVEHARMAYGLASAYAGRAVGPGRYDLEGVVLRTDAEAIVDSLIDEGCIGEILGAVEARAAADLAVDPHIAATYARIAEDEARHALLAWRALHWFLERGVDRVRVVRRLDTAIARFADRPVVLGIHRPGLGLWSDDARLAVHRLALRTVVAPLVERLAT